MSLFTNLRFESSVILEGSKTVYYFVNRTSKFESSVILEGSKTHPRTRRTGRKFESSVILEGSKTVATPPTSSFGLRVVLF